MKLNPEMMKELSKKNDGELWNEIRKIAAEHGYKLPESCPNPESLVRVREVLSGNAKMNYGEALKILNSYKNGRH